MPWRILSCASCHPDGQPNSPIIQGECAQEAPPTVKSSPGDWFQQMWGLRRSARKRNYQGECITYCFCVLSVWNYNSVTIKPRRGTLPSLCKARDSCHARCSSFTRVKPTFTASARLTSPSFLERAEEKLATFLMSCTRVCYARSYLCPGKALLVLLLWWLWRSAAPVW